MNGACTSRKIIEAVSKELDIAPQYVKPILDGYSLSHNGEAPENINEYVRSKLAEAPEYSKSVYKLWEQQYSNPIIGTKEEITAAKEKALKCFPARSISVVENNKGEYVLTIPEPTTNVVKILADSFISENEIAGERLNIEKVAPLKGKVNFTNINVGNISVPLTSPEGRFIYKVIMNPFFSNSSSFSTIKYSYAKSTKLGSGTIAQTLNSIKSIIEDGLQLPSNIKNNGEAREYLDKESSRIMSKYMRYNPATKSYEVADWINILIEEAVKRNEDMDSFENVINGLYDSVGVSTISGYSAEGIIADLMMFNDSAEKEGYSKDKITVDFSPNIQQTLDFNKTEEAPKPVVDTEDSKATLAESIANTPTSSVTKIISGGQTGVDTIGLQVAKSLGIETGGTAPKGFRRESNSDNEDISSYGLTEITDEEQADFTKRTGKADPYTGRTELNVKNSDGTVYFSTNEDSAGRIATKSAAERLGKPFLENPTAQELRAWMDTNNIKVLNVAGNRGSRLNNGEEIASIIKEALTMASTQLVITNSSQDTAKKAKEIGGIDTLRHPDSNGMHFGNPFSHANYNGAIKVGSVKEAVQAFEQWLRGEKYQDVEPERRQWILDQINNGSLVGKPLVYYTDKVPDNSYGRATYDYNEAPNHAHILQKLINEAAASKQSNIQGLQTETAQAALEDALTDKVPEPKTPEEAEELKDQEELDKQEQSFETQEYKQMQENTQKEIDKCVALNSQMEAINSVISPIERDEFVDSMVNWISDLLTELQTNKEAGANMFEQFKDVDFTSMSRLDIVNKIGPNTILQYFVKNVEAAAKASGSRKTARELRTLFNNMQAVTMLATAKLQEEEQFTFSYNESTGTLEASEKDTTNPEIDVDNYDTDTLDALVKELGDAQEAWQIEARTQSVFTSMTALVRHALGQCYILQETGKDKDGQPIYDKVYSSKWGTPLRVNKREAVAKILNWSKGATSLEQIIAALEAHKEDNLWVTQLLDRLNKADGSESDFQGQFASTFLKHTQAYTVVKFENGKYVSIPVNTRPALGDALKAAENLYILGEHPLFTSKGVNESTLETLKDAEKAIETAWHQWKEGRSLDADPEEIADVVAYVASALGYTTVKEQVLPILNEENLSKFYVALSYINKALSSAEAKKDTYNPFDINNKQGIRGNVKSFLDPITAPLEDSILQSVFSNGKLYRSSVTPSYLTKLFDKFGNSDEKAFNEFITNEFAQYEWFKRGDATKLNEGWRVSWLRDMFNNPDHRKDFAHKVQLSSNGKYYMKGMSPSEYIISVLTEFFNKKESFGQTLTWFRVPQMSNKPSSEFIQYYRYTGNFYKKSVISDLIGVYAQEIDRIRDVRVRNLKEGDERYIKNFDENGKRFNFLTMLNTFLDGEKANSKLGKLINKQLNDELTSAEEKELQEELTKEISSYLDARTEETITEYKNNGVFEACKTIENMGTTDEEIMASLENFIWNDFLASINIMELTITDKAFYKDEEDLQKRFAQLHSPGNRAFANARDYFGNKVSDGKVRSITLSDHKGLISNVIENVTEVFNRRIAQAPESMKEGYRALRDNILDAFKDINSTDAQAYSSPTSYRKKALMFGKWSKEAETIYQKIKKGETPSLSEIQAAFQPLKPFVYTQVSKELYGELSNKDNKLSERKRLMKVPKQFKNSEYLLIMADAILQGEKTGRPNLLRALFNFMENSAQGQVDANGNFIPGTKGIDVVQFDSAVKSGLGATIALQEAATTRGGETAAGTILEQSVYNADDTYNSNYVDEVPVEDYCIQQEIPAHYRDHEQAHGSQPRYNAISDLVSKTADGKEVKYHTIDKDGKEQEVNAKEFREKYEQTIEANINESIAELSKELNIIYNENGACISSQKDINAAISKLLQREISENSRYGSDILQSVLLDKDGNFNIPLGDPVQAKRIEQILNSIIKNRINKQKIAGGPLVQVSNFGTSRKLNIVFKSKEKNPDGTSKNLMSKTEFAKQYKIPAQEQSMSNEDYSSSLRTIKKQIDADYKQYLKDNQDGIAYFECFAPIHTAEVFQEFADAYGNIDIKKIEQVNPDLLKLVGYRIPCEDMYSMAPLKIVGFLPREAGDAIMMPDDMTTINGSDFDIDKFYIMRKELLIQKRFIQKPGETLSEAEEDYVKHNVTSITSALLSKMSFEAIPLTAQESKAIRDKANGIAESERRYALREYNGANNFTFINGELKDQNTAITEEREAKLRKAYEKKLAKIEERRQDEIIKEETALKRQKAKDRIKRFLTEDRYQPSSTDDAITAEIRKAYMQYMYQTITPSKRAERNNTIVDMNYEILTHPTTAHRVLTPQSFEEQKKIGYAVTAMKNPAIREKYTYDDLIKMSAKELKKLCYTDKNLNDFSTHVQFYRQNSAAGTILGVFAVHKTAHVVLEPDNLAVNYAGPAFAIGGIFFGNGNNIISIDRSTDTRGNLISNTLGSLVASAADAVKDPVLNLMNINSETANFLNTMVRAGVPFETAALLLSQGIVTKVLNDYYAAKIKDDHTYLSSIISKAMKELEKADAGLKDSRVTSEDLTRENLIKGLYATDNRTAYKVLNALKGLTELGKAIQGVTLVTRLNSITSAVGPLILDNIIMDNKFDNFPDNIVKEITDALGTDYSRVTMSDILDFHPILRGFYRGRSIADILFRNMPIGSFAFKHRILGAMEDKDTYGNLASNLYNDRKTLSKFCDFYVSSLLVKSGCINVNEGNYFINSFPREFIKQDIKGKYKSNPLIQAIKLDSTKDGFVSLKVDYTDLEQEDKKRLSTAWEELNKVDHELAMKLFKYNFFRGGIGFTPKSFMALLPLAVKTSIEKYTDTFTRIPNVGNGIIELFVQNNYLNTSVSKRVDASEVGIEKNKMTIASDKLISRVQNNAYITVETKTYNKETKKTETSYKLYRRDLIYTDTDAKGNEVITKITYTEIPTLGNKSNYLEFTSKPTIETKTSIEESDSEDMKNPTTDYDATDDGPVDNITDLIVKSLINKGLTEEEAYKKIAENKEPSAKERNQKNIENIKNFFRNQLTKMNIPFDESLVEEMAKEFC